MARAAKRGAVKGAKPADRRFELEVVLEGGETGNVCYFAFPASVEETFGTRARVPVCGTINGFPFRSSLSPMGGMHLMPVNAQLRAGAKCGPGDTVRVILQRDTAPRVIEPPAYMRKAIAKSAKTRDRWDKLSYSHKKEYVEWVEQAKKDETRARRLRKVLEALATGEKKK